MKKQFLVFAILVLLPLLAWSKGTLDVSFGYTMPGNHKTTREYEGTTYENCFDVTGSGCVSAEYVTDLKLVKGLIGGVGVQYLFNHKVDMTEAHVEGDPEFSFLPIYLLGGYKYPLSETTSVRGLVNFGYDIFIANEDYKMGNDLKGGLYWGLGAGFEFIERFIIDFQFNNYHGSEETIQNGGESSVMTVDISQSCLILRLGIKLPKDW